MYDPATRPIVLWGIHLEYWLYVPGILALGIGAGFALKAFLFARFRRIVQKTESHLDDLFVGALNAPLNLLIVLAAFSALAHWTPFGKHFIQTNTNVGTIAKLLTVLAGVLFADRLLRGAVVHYSDRVEVLRTAGGLLQGLMRALVIALGLLVLLDSLGVSITPILASLGIGSLAVAFALQPTLENFFAGVQIIVDRPVLPGHFIKLESGEEGYVEKIGWRTTWIRLLPNNMVIIPNKQLVSSRVLNYYYPSKELAVLVQVGVHYGSDLAKVERVTIEVAEEIQKRAEGAVRDFKPFIRFHTFNSSSIDFSVIMRAEEFVANYLMKHEFIKALQARYAQEGIVIPYPITAVNLEQEGASVPGRT
jgi:small-conductance mechanosensitive channel